jgi:hypothetical protein
MIAKRIAKSKFLFDVLKPTMIRSFLYSDLFKVWTELL